jgi:CRISPR-associated protein Csy3
MTKQTLPSFYSVSRAIQYSDGILTSLAADGTASAISVREFSVRGAKSSHGDAYKLSKSDAKVTKDINSPNPQVVDGAFLPHDSDRLRLSFSMNVLSASLDRQSCNNFGYTEKVGDFIKSFADARGFDEIAALIVWRISSAAALWRNYSGINKTVTVKCGEKFWVFDADELSTTTPPPAKQAPDLVAMISNSLAGDSPVLMLNIIHDVTIGMGQEVFPSQELEMKKESNSKSKLLYSVPFRGATTAAMHPQKIGAAIRAFDIWHPAFSKTGPLSIEPLGYSHRHQESFRIPSNGTDLYTHLQNIDDLISQLKTGEVSSQSLYLAGCFIRGGVFSGSPDEENKAAEKKKKAADKAAASEKKGSVSKSELASDENDEIDVG